MDETEGTLLMYRILFGGILLAVFAAVYRQDRRHEARSTADGKAADSYPGRTTTDGNFFWLPALLLAAPLATLLFGGPAEAVSTLSRLLMDLAISCSVYFLMLLALLPLLRRRISARACALLWLIPSAGCCLFARMSWASRKPLVMLRLPAGWVELLVGVWLAGFAGVLLWQLVSHLRFRRRLLTGAESVTEPEVLRLWEEAQAVILPLRPIPLLWSDAAASPLTIGLLPSAIRTVLPRRDYTPEELELIFRHELRHVQRQDVQAKLCYLCYLAVCWFNPLAWIAVKRAAADLELSCDEACLQGADEDQRRSYARLLLSTAGDSRGLTTCLSASAQGLRYRLREVLHPRHRSSGVVVLIAALLAVVLGSGWIRLSGTSGSLGELDLLGDDPEIVSVSAAPPGDDAARVYDYDSYEVRDPAGLLAALSALPVTEYARGDDSSARGAPGLECLLKTGDGFRRLTLSEGSLALDFLDEKGRGTTRLYLVDAPVDWDGLFACLAEPEQTDPLADFTPAELQLTFDTADGSTLGPYSTHSQIRRIAYSGTTTWPEREEIQWTGPEGEPVTAAHLDFSQLPQAEQFQVTIEGLHGETRQQIYSVELTAPDTLPLADYSARYTVQAWFRSGTTITYAMEFSFQVILPGDSAPE